MNGVPSIISMETSPRYRAMHVCQGLFWGYVGEWDLVQVPIFWLQFSVEALRQIWHGPTSFAWRTSSWPGLGRHPGPTNLPQYVVSCRWPARRFRVDRLVSERSLRVLAIFEIVNNRFVELLVLQIGLVCRWFLLGQRILQWSLVICWWRLTDSGHGNSMLNCTFLLPTESWWMIAS